MCVEERERECVCVCVCVVRRNQHGLCRARGVPCGEEEEEKAKVGWASERERREKIVERGGLRDDGGVWDLAVGEALAGGWA